MNTYKINCLLLAVTAFLFFGCKDSPEAQYKAMERQETESGIRYDSLFKGLYFGMKHDAFREYCYHKNIVEHDFKNGGTNTSWLESKINDMSYPAAINFYPVFKEGVITEMNASVYYKDAVFKDGVFERDSLLLDVLDLMKKWYGKEFIKIKGPSSHNEDIYVSVHGNRRITVYPALLNTEIRIWMVDLYYKEKENEK